MFHKLKNKKYYFNNNVFKHYIDINRELTEDEQRTIGQILASFPHGNDDDWPNKFTQMNFEIFPKELLSIAANAYDSIGNTMLGVACEYGKKVEVVQQLINMGANLDTPDQNMNKLALHWAICNQLSYADEDSDEAAQVVKCLLENGARTDITCYQNISPLEYAKDRGYTAAARLIEEYALKERSSLHL